MSTKGILRLEPTFPYFYNIQLHPLANSYYCATLLFEQAASGHFGGERERDRKKETKKERQDEEGRKETKRAEKKRNEINRERHQERGREIKKEITKT